MKEMNKHTKLRVESWCKKFCQITANIEWKKNRNLHIICLLDMIINNHYEDPYNKFAPDGPLPKIQIHIAKSRLSEKFWNLTKIIFQKSPPYNYQKNYINDINIDSNNNKIKNERNSKGIHSYRYMKENKINKNHFCEMICKCENPELLKKIIEKLENRINKANDVIIQQEKERKQLLTKIQELESLIKPYLNNNI